MALNCTKCKNPLPENGKAVFSAGDYDPFCSQKCHDVYFNELTGFAIEVKYFDRQAGKMKHVELPADVDSVGIDIEQAGLIVEVNTDAMQLFQLGRRVSMYEYEDLLAEAAAER